jgi:hypothetical protein
MSKLLPAFLCLDVYIHWLRLFRFYSSPLDAVSQSILDADRSKVGAFTHPYDRHASIILVEACANGVYWSAILLAARWTGAMRADQTAIHADVAVSPRKVASRVKVSSSSAPAPESSPTPLLSALLLSSFGKFFLLLPLVWCPEYTHADLVTRGVKMFVLLSNVQACAGERGGGEKKMRRVRPICFTHARWTVTPPRHCCRCVSSSLPLDPPFESPHWLRSLRSTSRLLPLPYLH